MIKSKLILEKIKSYADEKKYVYDSELDEIVAALGFAKEIENFG